jgi:hypothetical protein
MIKAIITSKKMGGPEGGGCSANTWVAVPYTVESTLATSGSFSVKHNAALGIMRMHFAGEKISAFTIGMKVVTPTLPKAIPEIQKAVIGFDLWNTSTTGRHPMGIDVNTNGTVTVVAQTVNQGSGAVPTPGFMWDDSRHC